MTKQTIHALGVSQTRICVFTPDGNIEAISSVSLNPIGQWHGSVRLSSSSRQDGYHDAQLTAIKEVISEAVDETARLLALRRSGMDIPVLAQSA